MPFIVTFNRKHVGNFSWDGWKIYVPNILVVSIHACLYFLWALQWHINFMLTKDERGVRSSQHCQFSVHVQTTGYWKGGVVH